MSRRSWGGRPLCAVATGSDALTFFRRCCRLAFLSAIGWAAGLGFGQSASATPLNILFYGNSFMRGDWHTMPGMLSSVAVAAGHDAPNTVDASVDSADLGLHLQYNSAAIGSALPPGETWDYVVLQNYSTAPTHLGDLAQHRADTLALYQAVAAHSAGVVPILLETWARAPGHEFYLGSDPDFPGGPAQMQEQLREGYALAAQDIDDAVGGTLALVAPVGSLVESAGFPSLFYQFDLYHFEDRGMLLSALVLYDLIYASPSVHDIDLSNIFSGLGLAHDDGELITSLMTTSTTIPEPSSQLLFALALSGLAIGPLRWRSRPSRPSRRS